MSYEAFLKNIDAIVTPVLLIGLDGTIKIINRAFVEAAGLRSPASHYVGRAADDLLGKDLVKSCVDLAQKAISQKGSIKNFSFARRNSNGEKIFWDVTVTQWLVDDLSDGVLLSFKEVGRDYSQSREHRFMDAIIDGARDALLIMTGDYRLKKVNQTFLDLLGGKAEDYLKHNLREFLFDFDRFVEEIKNSSQGMPFLSVFRKQDNEPLNFETVARCYPASMFASSEQSGVSEVYWVLELRALDEKNSRIVEVLFGKNRLLEDHLVNMKELIAHLNQQIAELSANQKSEEDFQQEKDWADNLMAVSEELEKLRAIKQDMEMRLRLLQNKYNTEAQEWQKYKEDILTDYQTILQEKQAVLDALQVLRDELDKLRQAHTDDNDAMNRLKDENHALHDELAKKNIALDEANGLVKQLQSALGESDQFLAMARQEAVAQELSLTEFRQMLDQKHEAFLRLEDEKLVLQEQHRLALEELKKQHQSDLDKSAFAMDQLKREYDEKLANTEQSYKAVCVEYEKIKHALADLQRKFFEQNVDIPVAMSGQLLFGAVKILENFSSVFTESLSDLSADLKELPAVKTMEAARQNLEKFVNVLHKFDQTFLNNKPSPHALLDTCQSWQEEFARLYPSLDLYFKYPVDGEMTCYEPQLRAIVRELVENAAEATLAQSDAEVKVKIQIKSPEEMEQCHFKKEIGQNCLLVQVVDNGKNLFDPEQAVKHYHTNKYGHLGLGLSIVRFLLESLGGELELLSTPNGGVATFYVPLP